MGHQQLTGAEFINPGYCKKMMAYAKKEGCNLVRGCEGRDYQYNLKR